MPNVEHFEVAPGENRTLTLHARDSANAVVNLTSKTVAWYVGVRPNDPTTRGSVFSKTGSTVSASAGTFTVAVTPSDTQDLAEGDYEHQAWTTDGSGNKALVSMGRFRLMPRQIVS